ncbi:hypothetical protein [Streptomyces sp. NPDC001678]|uniref:hypothetical protein n=1 Tax=Streptomyces sp. NPDC001678 TaxID=3364599 RepID=UPI0036C7DD15
MALHETNKRKLFRRAAAVAAATATAAVMAVGTAEAKPADGPWAGCPWGAVCVYPQDQNPAVSPSLVFESYGAHNLSNQYGNHWVLNNQYGGAYARACTGYNGGGSCTDIALENGLYLNLTPINSIVLVRP